METETLVSCPEISASAHLFKKEAIANMVSNQNLNQMNMDFFFFSPVSKWSPFFCETLKLRLQSPILYAAEY